MRRATVDVNQWQSVAALAMGGIGFVLILLLGARSNSPGFAGPLILALVPAGLLAIWIATRAASAKAAWGRGCFVNGLLSIGVAMTFWIQEEPWSGRPAYPDELYRGIGPLTDFIWPLVAWAGLAGLILAAILLAFSWWLLDPPHRRA